MKNRYVIAIAALLAFLFSLLLGRWFPWWGYILILFVGTIVFSIVIDWAYKRDRIKTIVSVALAMVALVVIQSFSIYKSVTPPLSLSVSTKGIESVGPYSYLQDPSDVDSGKDFTPTQKQVILQENRKRNNGQVCSDLTGRVLVPPRQYAKGQTPPRDEWQIDHICPKVAGGTNSYDNAQVLSRSENLIKLDDATLCPR